MKIEKLNEDKIRITLSIEELIEKNISIQSFMSNTIESQDLFLDMLEEAEKEVGFITKDCKLMIEAIATSEGLFVFTVTKYDQKSLGSIIPKKKVTVKRKKISQDTNTLIYSFYEFDDFCKFCDNIANVKSFLVSKLAKKINLYSYKNTYYLVLENIISDKEKINLFTSYISEFGRFVNNSYNFKFTLHEYGKIIMKHNAINTCKKYFCKK